MIRTRDFLLYVIVLVFLLMAVIYTGWFSTGESDQIIPTPNFTIDTNEPSVVIDTSPDESTRIAILKEKLAAGEGQIVSAPPIFTSVDSVVSDEAIVATTTLGARMPQYCAVPISHPATTDWGSTVEARILENTLQVSMREQVEVLVGTSTELVTEERLLASIPLRSVRSTFDSCLPDTTIGVTLDGNYIDNNGATSYHNATPVTLIGYARDGFPIYGPVAPEIELDACGGRYENFTYQYHVRSNEAFMLGCYAGIPAALN